MGSNDPADREDIALSTSELDDVLSSAEIRSESGNDEESGLEKYGIWIKVEPETLESGSILDAGPAAGSRLTAEEEQLLGELEADAEEPTLAAQADIPVGLRSAGETADFEGLEGPADGCFGGRADRKSPTSTWTGEYGRRTAKSRSVPCPDNIPELDSLEEPPNRGCAPLAASSDAMFKDRADLGRSSWKSNLKKAGRSDGPGGHAGRAGLLLQGDDSIA
jgi:hypothetical protein